MKKNNVVIISLIAGVFLFVILGFGTLGYIVYNNNNNNIQSNNINDDEDINQKVDELVEKKLEEKENEKKQAEKTEAEKKAAKNKENFISAADAQSGDTKIGTRVDPFTCTITAKEKKIPSNVEKKAEGGMVSCAEKKYRDYVPFDSSFEMLSVGDEQFFPNVRWIESNLYFLASVAAG